MIIMATSFNTRAFSGLLAHTLKWLLEPQNEHRLNEILSFHVVRGRFDCKRLKQIKTARTEQGQELRIDLRQTILIDSARIVIKDIDATNGIIHGIDSLLMPCAVAAAAKQRFPILDDNQFSYS